MASAIAGGTIAATADRHDRVLHHPARYQTPMAAVSSGHFGFQIAATATNPAPSPARIGLWSSRTMSTTPAQNRSSVNGSERTSITLRSYVHPRASSTASTGMTASASPAACDANIATQSAAAVPAIAVSTRALV